MHIFMVHVHTDTPCDRRAAQVGGVGLHGLAHDRPLLLGNWMISDSCNTLWFKAFLASEGKLAGHGFNLELY